MGVDVGCCTRSRQIRRRREVMWLNLARWLDSPAASLASACVTLEQFWSGVMVVNGNVVVAFSLVLWPSAGVNNVVRRPPPPRLLPGTPPLFSCSSVSDAGTSDARRKNTKKWVGMRHRRIIAACGTTIRARKEDEASGECGTSQVSLAPSSCLLAVRWHPPSASAVLSTARKRETAISQLQLATF